MKIAIIPARSGSKGLPDKNIINLAGHPLIYYTISAAARSRVFDEVIFTTDSEEYAEIASGIWNEIVDGNTGGAGRNNAGGNKNGGNNTGGVTMDNATGDETGDVAANNNGCKFITLIRGEEISNDKASTYDVIKDVFDKINLEEILCSGGSENSGNSDCSLNDDKRKIEIDSFMLLQPTSPMRNENHIRDAINLFDDNKGNFDFLVSVKEAEHASVLVKEIGDDLSLKNFDTDFKNYRRQGYKEYSPNGAIFIGKPEAYLERGHFFGDKSIAYIMDKKSSVDIDDEIDLKLAEAIISR